MLDAGTPAITILQLRAQQAGGDTVEVTNSEQTYRAGGNRDTGHALTLTTLTGNAYRCAPGVDHIGAQKRAGQASTSIVPSGPEQAPKPVELDPERYEPYTASSSGGWQPWNDTKTENAQASGILVVAPDGRTNLSFACFETARGKVLSAGIAVGRSAKRSPEGQETSTIQLRFDDEMPISIPIIRPAEGLFLQFYENDVPELANLMKMHDQLLVMVWFEDGSSEVFEFNVRGFSQAVRSTTAGCGSR